MIRKIVKTAWIGFFLFGCLFLLASIAQTPPPRPLTLHAAQGAGAPTDVPGINTIDVVLTLSFDGAVRRTDVDGVGLKGGGVIVPPAVLKSAKWDAPESRVLRLVIPLEELLHAGIPYDTGTTVLSVECELTMRGGASFLSRVRFDVGDPEGVTRPFQAVDRPSTTKPVPPATTAAKPAPKAVLSIVVTKPNPDKKNPFDEEPLAIPLAGALVVIDFERDGQPVHLEKTMPDKGDIRIEVPLDAPVTLKWEKESRTVACTAKSPAQSVVFSTLKIKTVSTSPVIK